MGASMNSQTVATATTANLDAVRLAGNGSGRSRRALGGSPRSGFVSNRSMSFELHHQNYKTGSNTGIDRHWRTRSWSRASASASAASSAAMRTGGEHVMQNAPWTPQFSDEVGEQVRVFVNNGLQEARLQLTPADLGRVQITINTEGDHARVVFVAETAVAQRPVGSIHAATQRNAAAKRHSACPGRRERSS